MRNLFIKFTIYKSQIFYYIFVHIDGTYVTEILIYLYMIL